MGRPLVHRGPDDEGVWQDRAAGVALAFRRLSILDLSASGHQPMMSHDGRYVIVFNGEVYNHRELRDELRRDGATFRGTSDTEVILAGAVAWGMEATVPRLWGMFALAVWDTQERRLLLARDRLGKKPLYWATAGAWFLFGSELKALRSHPGFRANVNREALTLYFRHGFVPSPWSIYHGVYKLAPGSLALVVPGRAPVIRRYWDLRAIAAEALDSPALIDEEAAVDELRARLRDAVARRMVADVPLGAMLSGGIDSSAVVASMQAQSSRPIRTFSIGFAERDYDEAAAARAVARHLGTDHTELYVAPAEARAVIPQLPDVFDEPLGDSSQIPTFLVSQLARRAVTVCLSGDGGDETFGGYVRYLWAERLWRRLAPWPQPVRRMAGRALAAAPAGALERAYGLAEPLMPGGWRQRHAGEKLHKLSGVLDAAHADDIYWRLATHWRSSVVRMEGPVPALSAALDGRPAGGPVERMMCWDQLTYLPDDILVKVDRASMAHSLEVRAPLLDHRLTEWAWRLPLSLKLRAGQGKWLLRRVLEQHVPKTMFDRPKSGFGIPVGEWLRGPLRAWAEALLDPARIEREGYLYAAEVQRVWQNHLRRRRNDDHRLWIVLMFQAWRERWQA
jgi:asparagine synthase (glutamine-hydrolysing)